MSVQCKKQLRERMLKRRKGLAKEEREQAAQGLLKQIVESRLWKESTHIGCYLAQSDELDTTLIMRHAANTGKKISVPVVTAPGIMKFVRYQIGDVCAIHSKYGIREPLQYKKDSTPGMDLLIVPAIALDVENHRLGYGAGYYDRFLHRHPLLLNRTIGVAFKCCHCTSVMSESHDQKMASIILA